MPGKAAVVVTASALSVTVGVLIGIVLIIGSKARQYSAVTGSTAAVTTAGLGSSVQVGLVQGDPAVIQLSLSPAPVSPTPVSPTPVSSPLTGSVRPATTAATPTSQLRTTPTTTRPRPPTPTPLRATTSPPAMVFTTVTIAPPTSSTVGSTTSTTTSTTTGPTASSTSDPTTASTTSSPTAFATAAAGPVAGRPCAGLGEQATAPGGATVFCQHDFATGSLAWRAVVDGGGCLSRRMTGIGTDGRAYLCRPDRKGLDHWRRA